MVVLYCTVCVGGQQGLPCAMLAFLFVRKHACSTAG